MKKILSVIAGLALLSAPVFTSCNKASDQKVQTESSNNESTSSVLRVRTEDFAEAENTLEIIEKYGMLYTEGDIIILSLQSGKTRVTFAGTEPQPPVHPGSPNEHTIESKSKLDFARACDRELQKGACLKVGYDKATGTYWADSVPC